MKKLISSVSTAISSLSLSASVALAQTPIAVTPPAGALDNVQVNNLPQFLITFLFIIGVLAAVIYLIYGGIKWVISGGDKTAVEAARNHIVAAIIGLVIVAAAFFILNVVFAILGVSNPLSSGKFCIPTLANPKC